jgi:heme/copper-type cytochrome/quinol oxidase subunit 2
MIYLPNELLATNNNPLITELTKSYAFRDPTTWANEVSRTTLNNSLEFFKFTFASYLIKKVKDTSFGVDFLNSYLFFYLMGSTTLDSDTQTGELFKNQFRPLRKGVTNMLRLHATGAIAVPIEVRLQILASSRDVIHSWAIPSAGIKIDCIPGYTSHRIMIFMMEGIY